MRASFFVVLLLACSLLAFSEAGAPKPRITAVDPAAGAHGDLLCAVGTNLGPDDVAAVFLTDGKKDFKVEVVEQNGSFLKFKVPGEAHAGSFAVKVLAGGKDPAIVVGPVRVTVVRAPFEEWLGGSQQTQMAWTARIFPPFLSSQQRLLGRMQVQIDGAELMRRREHGQMILFAQLKDEQGAAFESRGVIDLDKVAEALGNGSASAKGISGANVTYDWYAFVTPGDYRVSFGLLDAATAEHSVKRDKLHVTPLRKDPLPDAWSDLPHVEFRPAAEPPDLWYLPTLRGRLRLPVESSRPAHVELVVNLTPSEQLSGPQRIRRQNLNALLPAIKAISQLDLRNGSLDITLLDLSRRHVVFHAESVRDLDWTRLKESLAKADVWTVDVKSLEDRKHNAAFFVSEVARRIAGDQPRILIVLSSPVAFDSGEDLSPIRVTPEPDFRAFYVRLHSERAIASGLPDRPRRRTGMGGLGRGPRPAETIAEFDQLASTLKPLGTRVFDVSSPQEFRGALATMLKEMRTGSGQAAKSDLPD